MSWTALVPTVLVAVAVLVVPGLMVTYAAGWRGVTAWGAAPALSVVAVAGTAVVAGLAGVRWSVLPVAAVVVLVCAALWPAGRRWPSVGSRDPWGLRAAAGAGLVLAGLIGARMVARATGSPEDFPQTFDAVFHLNALEFVAQRGDASSLTLGHMVAPESRGRFYPAAWHGVTTLVMDLAGVGVVPAVSAVSVAVVAVALPLSTMLLVRVVLGRDAVGLVAAALGSVAFAGVAVPAFYGTLWPNAVGLAVLPALLAFVAMALAPGEHATLGRGWASVASVVLGLGVALAHPNITVSVLLAVPVVLLARATRPGLALRRRGAELLVAGAVGAVVVWVLGWSPVLAGPRATDWRRSQTLAQAVGEVLLVTPSRAPLQLLAATLVLTGLVVALRRPSMRWLALTHLTFGALYVLASGSEDPLAERVTGAWYNDAFRLGSMVAVTAGALLAVGVVALVGAARERWPALARVPGRPRAVLPGAVRPGAVLPGAALVALALVLWSGAGDNAAYLRQWAAPTPQLGPAERTLVTDVGRWVGPGEVVASNPFTGGAYTQALGGRETLYPHLSGVWDDERATIASSLAQVERDPAVCPALRARHVRWVIAGERAFWPTDRRARAFPGLDIEGRPGFEPVAHGGRLTLYRITACP